jgi:hypothetical protein
MDSNYIINAAAETPTYLPLISQVCGGIIAIVAGLSAVFLKEILDRRSAFDAWINRMPSDIYQAIKQGSIPDVPVGLESLSIKNADKAVKVWNKLQEKMVSLGRDNVLKLSYEEIHCKVQDCRKEVLGPKKVIG